MLVNRTAEAEYKSFLDTQSRLAGILGDASAIMAELKLNKFADTLRKLSAKTKSDSFKIQVVGTFKNGKSTFINSFLGEEVLPAYALPCTAVINEVKYGPKKRAVLHFKNPLPEVLPEELSEKTKIHMKRHGMRDIPPMEIPYDEIEDYVIIPIGKDPKEMILESPYERVELFWPLPLLRNGIEIIDSPGLNEHSTRTKVTMDYLTRADAILFVLSATSLCTKEEMTFVENHLFKKGFKDPFFVINRYDLIPPEEQKSIIDYAKAKLCNYTTFGDKGLFFLSAREALDGKMENDKKRLINSGLPRLENHLSEFLTQHRGSFKLLQPARELKRIIFHETLFKIIPHQRELLNHSLDEIKQRYELARPRIEALREMRNTFFRSMLILINSVNGSFQGIMHENLMSMSEQISQWVNEYVPTQKAGFMGSGKTLAGIASEIVSFISGKLGDAQDSWIYSTLIPQLSSAISKVFQNAPTDLMNIFEEYNDILSAISGDSDSKALVPVTQRVTDMFEDIALSECKFIIKSAELKPFVQSLAFESCKNTINFIPPALMPSAISALVLNSSHFVSNPETRAKKMVTDEMTQHISRNVYKLSDNMESVIVFRLLDIAKLVVAAVDEQISELERQLTESISELEKGSGNVSTRHRFFDDCESKITTVGMLLDALTFSLN